MKKRAGVRAEERNAESVSTPQSLRLSLPRFSRVQSFQNMNTIGMSEIRLPRKSRLQSDTALRPITVFCRPISARSDTMELEEA